MGSPFLAIDAESDPRASAREHRSERGEATFTLLSFPPYYGG
jgi:hypothetical protein